MSADQDQPDLPRHQRRIDAVRQHLNDRRLRPIDALLVTAIPNIFYLSGFTGSTAMLLITASDAFLITDGRYTIQARSECPDYTLWIADGSGGYSQALGKLLETRPDFHGLGFDDSDLTIQRFKALRKASPSGLRWIPAPRIVERLRFVKDAGEIELMRHAVKIAEKAFDNVRNLLMPGIQERHFAIELEFIMRRLGAECASFDTIVASGPNGALPHYRAGDRHFEAGDLVTIDWGAKVSGYCSDITRTVAIPGKAVDPKLVEIYNVVQQAKIDAIAACRPNENGKLIDSVARRLIEAAGYGEQFSHSLGHSLGVETHDGMTLSVRSDKVVLTPGTVTTVEPGIYIDGLGGVRIEEDVWITENGPVVLTTSEDEFI